MAVTAGVAAVLLVRSLLLSSPATEVAGETEESPSVNIQYDSMVASVYDEDPVIRGVRSFSIRIRSVSTLEEIDTDDFDIAVVDESGVESRTFSHFLEQTLPVGSSVFATVRAEGVAPGRQFVVVRIDGVELIRTALSN